MADLLEMLKTIKTMKFLDLTHSFDPSIPHWSGFPQEKREVIFDYGSHGFRAEYFSHVGQWGTHVDPPCHFIEGGRTLDQLDVKDMILPLAVIDVHQKVAQNPDYVASPEDLAGWEKVHGTLPPGAFVALRTDWSKRWPDAQAIANADSEGKNHTPGWGIDLLKLLCEGRGAAALGHETTDTDPSSVVATDGMVGETYVLKRDIYQIEMLTNLDQLPAWGAIVVAAWPKPKGGSGFPARVFAIVP